MNPSPPTKKEDPMTGKITILRSVLATALGFAPTKDIRFYLNTVHIRKTDTGKLTVEATDGGAVAVCELPNADGAGLATGSYLIPREALANFLKAIKGTKFDVGVELAFTQDPVNPAEPRAIPPRRFSISAMGQSSSGLLVDGVFPDLSRVTAKPFDRLSALPVIAQMQPCYMDGLCSVAAAAGHVVARKGVAYPYPAFPLAYQLIPPGMEVISEGETHQTANRRLLDVMLCESIYMIAGAWKVTVMPLRNARDVVANAYNGI
jgi:DNA polymerase III beta subunit, central domain